MKDKYAKFVDLSNQAIQDLNQGTYLIYIIRDMVVNVWYNYDCSSSIKVNFLYDNKQNYNQNGMRYL